MKTYLFTFLLIFTIFIGGCDSDKYLDLYPLTSITEGKFYNSELELKQGLNDVYRQLCRIYDAHGIVDLYGEQTSDNTYIFLKGGGDNFTEQINEFRILSDNERIRTAWRNCYNAIHICNTIIYHLDNTSLNIDSNLKNSMKAESVLVRSLIYFNMVRVWGDIPFVVEPITPMESYNLARENKNDIYEKIISDLNFAKTNLPANYTGTDVGRVTMYAASGVLAKLYLTIGNKQAAQNELEFIINSGKFSLDANNNGNINADDYSYIFAPNTKNSKSSILEVQYLAGVNANNSNHQNVYTPFHWSFNLGDIGGPKNTFRGEGINTPTSDLANEFENGDPRKRATFFPGYTDHSTGKFIDYPWTVKYFDPNWTNPGKNLSILRYADILLMYSEVTNDAKYLNMVRSRVGLPPYGSDNYPSNLYSTLQRAIEHERRVELAFEFHRFFDLVRTGRAIEVMKVKGYDINDNKLLFPIPQSEIDINPKLTQNPGYN